MDKKIWKILGIVFTLITLVLIFLIIIIPITLKNKARDDVKEKSIPSEDNTRLWANFPGELNSSTIHTLKILEYTEDRKNVSIKEIIELNETTEYDNFDFNTNEKRVFFDAKSKFKFVKEGTKEKENNGQINTINLGMFETLETLSNPPLYQKGINSIYYLFNKAFQSPDSFIRHIFSFYYFKAFIKYEDQVYQKIFPNVAQEKAKKVFSDDEKYSKYSFKSNSGFYQWVKILGVEEEINKATWLKDLFEFDDEEINSVLGKDYYLYNEFTDFNKELAIKLDEIKQIYKDADTLIKDNGYDAINFYGVLFCYLSSYDKANFFHTIKNFSMGNSDILYEILIIYYSHFKDPLNQDAEFYNKFIKYAIKTKKEFKILVIILDYIEDIEAFLYVLNENKDDIVSNYIDDVKTKPMTLVGNLKLIKKVYKIAENKEDKKEIDNIIKLIEDIIKCSNDKEILILYLKSPFWRNLLRQYNISDLENIHNCSRLRTLYKKYNDLINKLYKDSKEKKQINIKEDINRYNDRDEFAFNLNKNIKELFEIDKTLNDEKKLGVVEKYNPYYNVKNEEDEKKYRNLRETAIFDNINFTDPTLVFKQSFHLLNFENMFSSNISEFINTITSKIKDISTFGTINEIIDTSRFEKEKKDDYFNILKEKYELIILPEIKGLKEEKKINKVILILAHFISKIFLHEKITTFLEDKIEKLDEKIKSLIYIELLKKFNVQKFKEMLKAEKEKFINMFEEEKEK